MLPLTIINIVWEIDMPENSPRGVAVMQWQIVGSVAGYNAGWGEAGMREGRRARGSLAQNIESLGLKLYSS